MSYYEWLSKGSDAHTAEKFEAGLSISAKDSSREALEQFQPIAWEVFERQSEEGYQIILVHYSDRVSGDLYDRLVLSFE
jgi:hypothetical protein